MDERKVIYTVAFGEYELNEPEYDNPDWEFICFSDRDIESVKWNVVRMSLNGLNKQKASRLVKIKYDDYLDCDVNIYLDTKFKVKCDLNEFVSENLTTDIAVMKHNKRDCVYEECKFCKKLGIANSAVLDSQMREYKIEGLPKNFGLYAPGIMIRRDTQQMRFFMDEWFREIIKYTARDIPSFSYIVWKNKINISTMPFGKTYRKFR